MNGSPHGFPPDPIGARARGVRVYGHRGAPAELPENTLASFARAVACGVHGIETDLHETRDGVLVLTHDASLQRTAGVSRTVAELTYAELCEIPLRAPDGRKIPGDIALADLRTPRLDDALDRFPEMFFNIEVKPNSPALARRVAAHLRARGDEGRVRLAGERHRVLRAITPDVWTGPRSSSTVEVAKLYFAPKFLLHRGFLPGDALQVPVSHPLGPWTARFDSQQFLERARLVGLQLHYWTINEPSEAVRLAKLGASVIMTDDPATIVPALRAFA